MFHVPDGARRVTTGDLASDDSFGANGAFVADSPEPGWKLFLIITDGAETEPSPGAASWEHVSVQALKRGSGDTMVSRVPTWKEMCHVKALCWEDEDTVMQLHPPKSDYVNTHPSVLHLWRHRTREIPRPPRVCV